MGNEHQPKCSDVLWLGIKGKYGLFYLCINVRVAGKTKKFLSGGVEYTCIAGQTGPKNMVGTIAELRHQHRNDDEELWAMCIDQKYQTSLEM